MTDAMALARPVFEKHSVPEDDRLFLFSAMDRLLEEDIDHADVADAAIHGKLDADSYEELLQQHGRGHRRNKAWFRSGAFEDAVPTRRGRALLRDFAEALSQEHPHG
jgi:hypothetical protein